LQSQGVFAVLMRVPPFGSESPLMAADSVWITGHSEIDEAGKRDLQRLVRSRACHKL